MAHESSEEKSIRYQNAFKRELECDATSQNRSYPRCTQLSILCWTGQSYVRSVGGILSCDIQPTGAFSLLISIKLAVKVSYWLYMTDGDILEKHINIYLHEESLWVVFDPKAQWIDAWMNTWIIIDIFTYRRDFLKLFLVQGPSESLHKCGISRSCGRDVEEGKCCCSLSSHKIRHRFDPQMIWFRHQNILFWNCMVSQPLYKCPWSIQYHISALER